MPNNKFETLVIDVDGVLTDGKFYYNKKHFGYTIAMIRTSINLFSASTKYLLYMIIFDKHKKEIYKMRLCGLLSSMVGKKSSLRLDD